MPRTEAEVDRLLIAKDEKARWSPVKKSEGREFPDVPDPIASVASEAAACQEDGRHRAAIMLARAVIESAAKANEAAKGSLFEKIEQLGKDRLLSPVVVAAAHAIRDSGNAVAHGDFAEYAVDIPQEEAQEVIDLMSLVLRECFQNAAVAERVATAAKNRKLGGTQSADKP